MLHIICIKTKFSNWDPKKFYFQTYIWWNHISSQEDPFDFVDGFWNFIYHPVLTWSDSAMGTFRHFSEIIYKWVIIWNSKKYSNQVLNLWKDNFDHRSHIALPRDYFVGYSPKLLQLWKRLTKKSKNLFYSIINYKIVLIRKLAFPLNVPE